jgi:transcriptional regulator with XRE-family HTH domain
MEFEVEAEVQRWSVRLRALIYERGSTVAATERALGWSNGYLGQVLRPGRPALKVEQVLALARFLEVPLPEFFGELYDLRPAGQATGLDPLELVRIIEERARAVAGDVAREELEATRAEQRSTIAHFATRARKMHRRVERARAASERHLRDLLECALSGLVELGGRETVPERAGTPREATRQTGS